jgi:hypothetical protein
VVNFDAQGQALVGAVVAVRITDVLPHSLRGALEAPGDDARAEPAGVAAAVR